MRQAGRQRNADADSGFTLVELMVVVLILGILIAIVIPVLASAKGNAQKKTCFANQREIIGVLAIWQVNDPDNSFSELAGVINASNPLVAQRFLRPPYCPSAPVPANKLDPQLSEGAYTLDDKGNVAACTFGAIGPHGKFQ